MKSILTFLLLTVSLLFGQTTQRFSNIQLTATPAEAVAASVVKLLQLDSTGIGESVTPTVLWSAVVLTGTVDTSDITGISSFAQTYLDDTTAGATLTTLGGTTVGQSVFSLTNPSAITWPRINANNTVTALSASATLSALGTVPKMMLCVIQPDASGVWTLIDDANHDPFGGTPVITQTSSGVTVTYASSFTKVYSAFATADEGLSKGGIVCGPSVGLSSLTIQFQKVGAMGGKITWTSGTTFSLAECGGIASSAWSSNALTLVMSHPQSAAVGLGRMATGYEPRVKTATVGDTLLTIAWYDDAGVLITTPDANCTCTLNCAANVTAGLYVNPTGITTTLYPSCNVWVAVFGE